MLAECLEKILESPAFQSTANAEAAFLAGLQVCVASSAACVQGILRETADDGLYSPDVVASAARTCTQIRPTTCGALSGSLVSACAAEPGSVLSAIASYAWTLVRWYNAVLLVVFPWVFLWIFSGSVLGLVRFARFQYQLVRIGVDVTMLMILYLVMLVEEYLSFGLRFVHSHVRESVYKRCQLEREMRTAKTFAAYHAAHQSFATFLAEDKMKGCCRRKFTRQLSGTEEEHLNELIGQLDKVFSGDLDSCGAKDLQTLEPLLVCEAGGIDWNGVPNCDEYFEKLSRCLEAACQARLKLASTNEQSKQHLLTWLLAREKAIGRTALCLSGGGSLAMYHMGVCRFLIEEGMMPKIISGVSGGSIGAGFLAIHTDEEILRHVFVREIVVRHKPHRWFPHWWQELFNFFRIGVLVPTEDFEGCCVAYFGDWTFEEAFARTGREVSVVISSNFSKRLPACVMLNHITVPRVTIASAVATSCAALGIMKPRGLVTKDASGTLIPFDILGKSFADGTFTAEVPKDYLRSFFGATQFLVSQVNPHVSSFLGAPGGLLQTFRSYYGSDLQQRARLLSEYNLLPSFFGRGMCQATSHLSQDFQESRSGLTVFPPDMGLGSVKAAVSNPSVRDMDHYILEGQRMAWARANEIRALMYLEALVARAVDKVEGRLLPTPLSEDQPPKIPSSVA